MYDVLKYRNFDVIKKYQKKFGLTYDTAEEHFVEMLKFLYVCSIKPVGVNYTPSPIVDEVWHIFLEDKEYNPFCKKYFEKEIGHIPNVIVPEHYYFGAKKAVFDLFGENNVVWPFLTKDQIPDCEGG